MTTNSDVNLEYTGERHIAGQVGVEMLPFANLEHMIRYAFVAPFIQGKRVLDVSCGSGYGTQYLALQGATQVVGVDIDQESIEFAQKFHQHPAITYIQSDAHHIQELADASFDVVISFETVEHVERPRDFLFELKRLLKADGQAFISCPNDYRVSPWISEFHLHKFRFSEFRDLMVSIFGETVFLGQHHTLASCLFKPTITSEKFSQFEAYRDSSLSPKFDKYYVEHISGIENADGYIGVVGTDISLVGNSLSISQDAFQIVMKSELESQQKSLEGAKKVQEFQDQAKADLLNYEAEYQRNLEYYQKKYQSEIEINQREIEINQQKLQVQLDTAYADIQSKQNLINILEEKVKILEERHGQLLRDKTYLENVASTSRIPMVQTQQELLQAQARITAMETSKFWQIRKSWFQFKRSLNLPGADKE
ncbi:methyltransferase domain-containing protein [Calothrix sp. PCC 6303]|uniref:methyltransferase domain-containing protein n=1 Tax=Calothrix sp. PCC 6303 TaxID=1170562 RepID=UPI0002A0398C|nr:methyltransferase domain-containing protein [Calothrix sp. PCC 6303]AFZ03540.1 Methyltransferase type 11 [Calothrix sp. PCC 6303]